MRGSGENAFAFAFLYNSVSLVAISFWGDEFILTAVPLRCVKTIVTLLAVTRLGNSRGLASSTVTNPSVMLGNLHAWCSTSPSWCANVRREIRAVADG